MERDSRAKLWWMRILTKENILIETCVDVGKLERESHREWDSRNYNVHITHGYAMDTPSLPVRAYNVISK